MATFSIVGHESSKKACSDVNSLVFGSMSRLNTSQREQAVQAGEHYESCQRIRVTTLLRYCKHRFNRMRELLFSPRPSAHVAGSMRIKWDETEQMIASTPCDGDSVNSEEGEMEAGGVGR